MILFAAILSLIINRLFALSLEYIYKQEKKSCNIFCYYITIVDLSIDKLEIS